MINPPTKFEVSIFTVTNIKGDAHVEHGAFLVAIGVTQGHIGYHRPCIRVPILAFRSNAVPILHSFRDVAILVEYRRF